MGQVASVDTHRHATCPESAYWRAICRQNGPNRPAADERERVFYFLYGYAPAEYDAYLLNDLQGQFGDIGEGGFSDGLSDAFGLSDEVAGRAVPVGDFRRGMVSR